MSALKATKYKMKKSCPQSDSNPRLLDLKSDALLTELAGLVESCLFKWLYYIHVLPNPINTLVYRYIYENDEEVSNLFCKCSSSCYTLEYIYIVQIAKTRTSPLLVFNMQIEARPLRAFDTSNVSGTYLKIIIEPHWIIMKFRFAIQIRQKYDVYRIRIAIWKNGHEI